MSAHFVFWTVQYGTHLYLKADIKVLWPHRTFAFVDDILTAHYATILKKKNSVNVCTTCKTDVSTNDLFELSLCCKM